MELLLGTSKVTAAHLDGVNIIFDKLGFRRLYSISELCIFNSVSWQVQELVLEYASLIEAHFGKLLSYVQRNNWRTNPNILVGARVAVFRKSATLLPGIATG